MMTMLAQPHQNTLGRMKYFGDQSDLIALLLDVNLTDTKGVHPYETGRVSSSDVKEKVSQVLSNLNAVVIDPDMLADRNPIAPCIRQCFI